jgi:hypothetical protein
MIMGILLLESFGKFLLALFSLSEKGQSIGGYGFIDSVEDTTVHACRVVGRLRQAQGLHTIIRREQTMDILIFHGNLLLRFILKKSLIDLLSSDPVHITGSCQSQAYSSGFAIHASEAHRESF